jgi:hypothetical protein
LSVISGLASGARQPMLLMRSPSIAPLGVPVLPEV